MQRVNHAYDEGDLLTLLTLQLETEQIDAAHLARVSTARLGHYNKVLREQVRELEQELGGITGHFARLTGQSPAVVTPAAVQQSLNREIVELKRDIKALKAHHVMLQEPAQRKRWLQQYARDLREEERLGRAARCLPWMRRMRSWTWTSIRSGDRGARRSAAASAGADSAPQTRRGAAGARIGYHPSAPSQESAPHVRTPGIECRQADRSG
jgi:hypothetical protein